MTSRHRWVRKNPDFVDLGSEQINKAYDTCSRCGIHRIMVYGDRGGQYNTTYTYANLDGSERYQAGKCRPTFDSTGR